MASKKKGLVFRVTGLPAFQPDELTELLETSIRNNLLNEEKLELEFSVAIVPSCYSNDERAALVEFHSGVPAFLSELVTNPLADWQVEMGDTDINFDQHFYGFTQLYTPTSDSPVTADIIAITGLDGHAYGSWRGKGNLGRMWLRDFLSKDLPCCRTMIYGYNSKLSSHGVNTIMDYGREMLEELKKIRNTEKLRKRPLFFIAHSFGGIILAHCLVKAVQTNDDDHPTIATLLRATYGMLLFGIPHKGLVVEDIQKMLADQSDHPRSVLLEQIRSKSDLLAYQLVDFKNLIRDRKVVSFFETSQTRQLELDSESKRWKRTGNFVTAVDTDSALLHLPDSMEDKIPLDADHSMIVKFDNKSHRGYTSARDKLRQFEQDAPEVVAGRFQLYQRGNVHWIVPRPINSLFTGRTELLERIQSTLRNRKEPSNKEKRWQLAITGMGGQGKSEVCLQVANIMREEFWGVFWVDVSSPPRAKNDFLTIAKALGSPAESVEEARQALSSTKQRWLLILDNADNPRVDYQVYFPSGTRGTMIITSRVPECSRYSTVDAETVEGLDLEHATQLLLKASRIQEALWPSYQKQAQHIVHLLGSHTLALIQAGAYVAGGYARLEQYPVEYQRHRKRLLEHHSNQEKSRYVTVYATFETSIEVLAQSKGDAGKDALDLLATLAMMHSSVLPLQIFEDAWLGSRQALNEDGASHKDTERVDALKPWHISQLPELICAQANKWDSYRLIDARLKLVSLSLVTEHQENDLDGLSMHSLAHAWARDRLEKDQQKQAWVSTGCVIALSRKQSNMWQVYEKELRPHLQSFLLPKVDTILSYAPKDTMLPIMLSCCWLLNIMRDDGRLELLLKGICQALPIPPLDPTEMYFPVWDLVATNMINMGHSKQAMALLKHVVKVRETTLVENHPSLLRSQHELAGAYRANGQIKEAVMLLEHVVKVCESILVENHVDRLASQHELAGAYRANGQIKEAVMLLEHVVKIHKITLAENHPDRLTSQHQLAGAYRANGQVKEAVTLMMHVVKIRETTLGENHPDRLASQHQLAGAYGANGQINEAVVLLEHIVKVQESTLAENHPSQLVSQYQLAGAYGVNGQIKKAVTLLEHVVKIHKITLAENHPDRLASQQELAGAYGANGQINEAVVLLEHVVEIHKTTLAQDHPSRLGSQHELAIAYRANGQIKDAVTLLEHVVKIQETTLAENHPSRLASQHELAGAYGDNGEIQEAVKLLEHVAKIQETTLAENHPSRLASQHELARLCGANGQIEEAVTLLKHVVGIRETTLVDNHLLLSGSRRLLAHFLSLSK